MVPVDDSLDPHLALRAAFSIGARTGRTVTLVRSCPADQAGDTGRSLEAAGARFVDVAPFSTQILDGPPVDAILDAAPEGQALVCLPTHARAGLSRLIFGSVAEDLIRRSTRPVLCIGPAVTDVPLPNERLELLVCTDDSSATDAVLSSAAMFAELLDASCIVAQAIGPDEDISTDGGPPPRPIRDQAQRHCQQSADRLAADGVSATSQVLHGHPPGTLVQYAATRRSSFIVVGTSGRTGLARHTLGSVAAGVLRHAHCPVLVVPTIDRTD